MTQRIVNDQYFSTYTTVEEQVQITYNVLKEINATVNRIIDPCMGIPNIIKPIKKHFPNIPVKAFDIEPKAEFIERQDVRTLKKDKVLDKVDGTLFISNPPFYIMGSFWANIKPYADYISMITYGSNYNFTPVALRAEFELLKSVDLGNREYSEVGVTTCLNIYKRKAKKTKVELYPKEVDSFIGTRTMIRYKSDKTRQKWNGYDLDLEKHDGKYQFFIQSRGTTGKIVENKEDLNRCGYLAIEIKDNIVNEYFNSQAYKDFVDRTNNSTKNLTVKSATMSASALKCDIAEWLRINSTYQEGRYVASTTDSKAKININDYAKLKFIKRTNIEKHKKWKDYREDLDTNHYDHFIISHGNVGRILYSKEELTHCEYIGVEFKNELIRDYFKSSAYKEYIKKVKNPTGTNALGKVSLRITDLKESIANWITTNSTSIDDKYETNVADVITAKSFTIDTIWDDLNKYEGAARLSQTISNTQINIFQKDSYYTYKPCFKLNENTEFNKQMADFKNFEILTSDTSGNCELYIDNQIRSELFIILSCQILYNDYDTI